MSRLGWWAFPLAVVFAWAVSVAAAPSDLLGIGTHEGILVTVTSPGGGPVARADVELRMLLPDDQPIEARGVTDAQGRVRLRLPPAPDAVGYELRVRTGPAAAWGVALGVERPVEASLQIGEMTTVRGRVVDERRRPVPDATVFWQLGNRFTEAVGPTVEPITVIQHAVSVDAGGRWSLAVPRALLEAGRSLRVEAPDHVPAQEMLRRDPWDGEILTTLNRGAAVSGIVLKPDGSPAVGALVELASMTPTDTRRALADRDGRFTVRGVNLGSYEPGLVARMPGVGTAVHALRTGDERAAVILRLRPTPERVTGRVVDADGRPFGDGQIVARLAPEGEPSARVFFGSLASVSPDGRFVWDQPVRSMWFLYRHGPNAEWVSDEVLWDGVAESVEIRVRPARRLVVRGIEAGNGVAVPLKSVTQGRFGADGPRHSITTAFEPRPDGTFEILQHPDATDLLVLAEGRAHVTLPIPPGTDSPAQMDVTYAPRGENALRVIDAASERPLTSVVLRHRPGESVTLQAGPDGRFRWMRQSNHDAIVVVVAEGYRMQVVRLLEQGGEVVVRMLPLEPPRQVRVTVTGPDGGAATGVVLARAGTPPGGLTRARATWSRQGLRELGGAEPLPADGLRAVDGATWDVRVDGEFTHLAAHAEQGWAVVPVAELRGDEAVVRLRPFTRVALDIEPLWEGWGGASVTLVQAALEGDAVVTIDENLPVPDGGGVVDVGRLPGGGDYNVALRVAPRVLAGRTIRPAGPDEAPVRVRLSRPLRLRLPRLPDGTDARGNVELKPVSARLASPAALRHGRGWSDGLSSNTSIASGVQLVAGAPGPHWLLISPNVYPPVAEPVLFYARVVVPAEALEPGDEPVDLEVPELQRIP